MESSTTHEFDHDVLVDDVDDVNVAPCFFSRCLVHHIVEKQWLFLFVLYVFFWYHFPNKNEDLPWQRTEMLFFVALRGSTLLWAWSRPQVSGGSALPGFLFRDHAHTIHGTGIFTPNLPQKWAKCRSICHTWMIWDISYIGYTLDLPPIHEAIVANESVFSRVVKTESWVGRSKLYRSVTSRSCYWPGFHASFRCVSLSMVAITSQTRL